MYDYQTFCKKWKRLNKSYFLLDFIQDIDELVGIVSLISKKNQEDIASEMGYSRPHFNTLLKKSRENPDADLLEKAKHRFEKDILLFVSKYGSLTTLTKNTSKRLSVEQIAFNLEVLAKSLLEISNSGEIAQVSEASPVADNMPGGPVAQTQGFAGKQGTGSVGKKRKQKDISS